MNRPQIAGLLFVVIVVLPAQLRGQDAIPPRFDELPKLAKTWPPAWAALVADIVPARPDFEKDVLGKLDALLRAEKPSAEDFRRADIVLTATFRHHLSVRRPAPLADNPGQAMQAELQDRLATLRKDWLNYLGDSADALPLADAWLPVTAPDSPLRPAILRLWLDHAKNAFEKRDYATARIMLFRMETNFDETAAAPIRKLLRDRAEGLFQEAQSLPDPQAIPILKDALQIWPRLPEARDALERRQGTFRTLVIGVPALPEQLSPATASTVVEKQALDLLFDRLYHAEHQRYAPQLAAALPGKAIPLRRDVFWSSGERVTGADLRHTALLMNPTLWREFLEMPRFESNPFLVDIKYRQGLLDPLSPLTFHVLPQLVRGKQLDRADDPEFSKAPVGSGPFQYVGRKVDGGKIYAVFQANPYDLRGEPRGLREIRMMAWSDPQKDLPKPLPQMLLDVPTDRLVALKKLGYVDVPIGDHPYLHFLAVNHRKPSLASVAVRRAMAHVLDRQAMLQRHFGAAAKDKYHATANSLLPRHSWAACPAPRVPAELYQPEQAKLYAQQAKKDAGSPTWTLKYPAGDAHIQKACAEIAQAIRALFKDAGIQADVQLQAVAARDLRSALDERNYDLLYQVAEDLGDPLHLAALFDTHDSATRPGGSNYLGYDNDVRLQELLSAALKYRQFSVAQTNMHAVDAHLYETMPAIPLWQLETHVLIQPTLRLPPLEAGSVFSSVRSWKP